MEVVFREGGREEVREREPKGIWGGGGSCLRI